MEAVKAGGDRQELHERIRVHARATADALKEGADRNDLFERLLADDAFRGARELLTSDLDPARFVGRSPEQVDEFLAAEVDPVLAKYADQIGGSAEVDV